MGGLLEPLRGGAQRELQCKRNDDEAWLICGKQGADAEEGTSYKDVTPHKILLKVSHKLVIY